jgi:hypothetical protein
MLFQYALPPTQSGSGEVSITSRIGKLVTRLIWCARFFAVSGLRTHRQGDVREPDLDQRFCRGVVAVVFDQI